MIARVVTLSLALCLPALAVASPDADPARGPRPPTVTADATESVRVAPDRAVVRLGVQQQAPTAKDAQAQVNRTMDQLLRKLTDLGLARKQIATSRVELYPVMEYPKGGGEARLVGFRASNVLSVELLLAEKGPNVGQILDAAVQVGSNTIEGVTFGLVDEVPHQRRALELAAKSARSKAESLATALGVRLGRLVHAREAGAVGGPPRPMMARSMMMSDMSEKVGAQVEPGEIEVQATATVVYTVE